MRLTKDCDCADTTARYGAVRLREHVVREADDRRSFAFDFIPRLSCDTCGKPWVASPQTPEQTCEWERPCNRPSCARCTRRAEYAERKRGRGIPPEEEK